MPFRLDERRQKKYTRLKDTEHPGDILLSDGLFRHKIPSFQPARNIDEADENSNFNEGSDYRRKCYVGIDTEHRDGNGDGQLEVIAPGGERNGGGLRVGGSDSLCSEERYKEHRDFPDDARSVCEIV